MATIIKCKKSYSVVYNFEDETGETRQKWETWHTHKDALRRKAEVESQQFNGIFVVPKEQTAEEYLYDFVSLYGGNNWGVCRKVSNAGASSQRCASFLRRHSSSVFAMFFVTENRRSLKFSDRRFFPFSLVYLTGSGSRSAPPIVAEYIVCATSSLV